MGINAAMDDVRNGKTLAVPEHLRTPTRKKLAAASGCARRCRSWSRWAGR